MDFLLVIACGLIDRYRGWGGNKLSKTIEQIIYGLIVSVAFVPLGWFTLVFAALFALGCAPGWGQPMGAFLKDESMDQDDLEWWQNVRGIPILRSNPLAAIAFRGVLWGVPLWLMAFWHPSVVLVSVAMPLAFVASLVAVKHDLFSGSVVDRWRFSEFIRGTWFMCLCLVGKGIL